MLGLANMDSLVPLAPPPAAESQDWHLFGEDGSGPSEILLTLCKKCSLYGQDSLELLSAL